MYYHPQLHVPRAEEFEESALAACEKIGDEWQPDWQGAHVAKKNEKVIV